MTRIEDLKKEIKDLKEKNRDPKKTQHYWMDISFKEAELKGSTDTATEILKMIDELKKFADNADKYTDEKGESHETSIEFWDGIYTFSNGLKEKIRAEFGVGA